MTTYYDTAVDTMISTDRAHLEFTRHGMDDAAFEEFLLEVTAHPSTRMCTEGFVIEVDAQATLEWLGY